MIGREAKKLRANLHQIGQVLEQVNINDEVRKIQYDKLKSASDTLKEFKDQITEEGIKKLSPTEQQVLYENTRNYSEVVETLYREVDFLDMNRHPRFVSHTLLEIEAAVIFVDKIIEDLEHYGKFIQDVQPFFHILKVKNWGKLSYKDQVANIWSELGQILRQYDKALEQIMKDDQSDTPLGLLKFHTLWGKVYTTLVQADSWMKKETTRATTEPMPEPTEIELPEIKIPEIPKAPEPVKEEKVVKKADK
jgi:hypothetical protein